MKTIRNWLSYVVKDTLMKIGRPKIILPILTMFLFSFGWQQAEARTDISGTIATNSTWTTAGSPWVITSLITIPSGVTLTIERGSVVMFAQTVRNSVYTGINVESGATLTVSGTAGSPVIFTDSRDTTTPDALAIGGSTPSAGWGGEKSISHVGPGPQSVMPI